jgi:hypothetical protein
MGEGFVASFTSANVKPTRGGCKVVRDAEAVIIDAIKLLLWDLR